MQRDSNAPDEIARARSALFAIPADLAHDRWVKVGMAAHAAGLGFDDFDSWSAQAGPPLYDSAQCAATWRSFSDTPPGTGVGPGTLFYIAREHGWRDDGAGVPPQDKRPSKAPIRADKGTDGAARAMAATTIWPGLLSVKPTESHPYIRRKQADGIDVANLRIVPSTAPWLHLQRVAGYLAVPIYRADGTLQSCQFMPPQEGDKLNLRFSKIAGGRHVVGEVRPDCPVYLVEGIATAWACWQATGHAAVCCFGWGNVRTVAHQLRRDNPSMLLTLVLDVGKESDGLVLAREVNAALVYMPQEKPSNYDAGDYARDYGPTELERLLLEAQLPPAPTTPETSASTEVAQVVDTAPEGKSWLSQLNVVFADDVSYAPPDELVEGVLVSEKTSVLYGDSNSGKTFLAIDIAAAVARGIDWQGRRTEQGAVLYLACEAPQSVLNRLAAYRQHHNCVVPSFAVVKRPVNFFQSEVDACAVAELVHEIERTGQKVRLVVVDTLARVSSGANENSGEDMGPVMARVDWIREKCHVHVLVIHHCGKNAAAGSRGWSGIRAAIDTEIEVSESVAGRVAEITKERDLGSKGTRLGFRLEPVTLGTTKWGAPSTTCIVVADDAPAAKPTKRMGECEGAVVEYLASKKVGVRKADVVKHFESRYDRGNVYRAIRSLVSIGAAHEGAGLVCIASAATQQS